MKKILISFFDEQTEQSGAIWKELGFSSFNAFVRVCVQEKIKKHSNLLKNGKK